MAGEMLGNHVVRWERRDQRVLLRELRYDIVADPNDPVVARGGGGEQPVDHHGVQY